MIRYTSFDPNFRKDGIDDDYGFVRDADVESLVLQEPRLLSEGNFVLL